MEPADVAKVAVLMASLPPEVNFVRGDNSAEPPALVHQP